MKKKIIIDASFPTEYRVALLDRDNNIEDIEYHSANKKQIKGNIYLAKVTRVEPSLQAAFVDYGDEKSGFLPFNEIHSDYYTLHNNKINATPLSLQEIAPPKITSEDLKETAKTAEFNDFAESDEIDVEKIEQLVNDGIESDFDIEADELDTGNDNDIDSAAVKKNARGAPAGGYQIQEVLKKGQVVLVQAIKEERGNKGASFTTFISLAGKYCVLMPNRGLHNGVSRKISNPNERRRLKDIINDLLPAHVQEHCSVIARTAGISRSTLDIKRDYEYLAKLWNRIRQATLQSMAPCFIHQEDGIILKAIRDMFDYRTVKEVVVQGGEAYNACVKFMQEILPTEIKSIKEYKGKVPIFTKFKIEEMLSRLYQPNVQLPSGGYVVINPTEALTAIDVNSGRATAERNIEKMALKTNLEAAKEIAKQIKLRDLSGLLVIDFIDMLDNRNKRVVERSLKEFLARDRAKIQTSNISNFGLLEMSRQRLRPSFLEINSSICSHCSGKGLVRAEEANAMLILRTIENEIYNSEFDIVNVYGLASSMMYLLNNKRQEIALVEEKYSIKLNFFADPEATSDSFSVETVKLSASQKLVEDNSPALANFIIEESCKENASPATLAAVGTANHGTHKKRRISKVIDRAREGGDGEGKNVGHGNTLQDAVEHRSEKVIADKEIVIKKLASSDSIDGNKTGAGVDEMDASDQEGGKVVASVRVKAAAQKRSRRNRGRTKLTEIRAEPSEKFAASGGGVVTSPEQGANLAVQGLKKGDDGSTGNESMVEPNIFTPSINLQGEPAQASESFSFPQPSNVKIIESREFAATVVVTEGNEANTKQVDTEEKAVPKKRISRRKIGHKG